MVIVVGGCVREMEDETASACVCVLFSLSLCHNSMGVWSPILDHSTTRGASESLGMFNILLWVKIIQNK